MIKKKMKMYENSFQTNIFHKLYIIHTHKVSQRIFKTADQSVIWTIDSINYYYLLWFLIQKKYNLPGYTSVDRYLNITHRVKFNLSLIFALHLITAL